jgi:hypothetical protein
MGLAPGLAVRPSAMAGVTSQNQASRYVGVWGLGPGKRCGPRRNRAEPDEHARPPRPAGSAPRVSTAGGGEGGRTAAGHAEVPTWGSGARAPGQILRAIAKSGGAR